jgi:NADPH-dependent curcumin reductase CurA
MPTINRQVILKNRPHGLLDDSTTEVVESELPELEAGQALVAVRYLSIDATIRTWMDDAPGYLPPIGIGEVIRSGGAGEVVASKSDRYAVGDLVVGMTNWQEYVIADESFGAMGKVPDGLDLATAMNVTGTTGVTAYIGIHEIGKLKEGDVVVVSGAAGATGSTAGQLAKIGGASKVVGIAGGPEKCALLVDEFGFDAAIDYKSESVTKRLRELCPQGIDLYYDNVGGEILDAALANLAMNGRIAQCGAISGYNTTGEVYGIKNYFNLIIMRGSMTGFLVLDYLAEWPRIQDELGALLASGQLQHREYIVDGLDRTTEALNALSTGANTGKVLVKVS